MPFHPLDKHGRPDQSYKPAMPTFDPFTSYRIKCLNTNFAGKTQGFQFNDGVAIVHGLDAGADADEQKERLEALAWFWNADGTWARSFNERGQEVAREWSAVYIIEEYETAARKPREKVTA